MAFAVVLYFDAPTEHKIAEFQQKLLHAGVPGEKINTSLRPHVTLGIFEEISCADCECKLNEIAFELNLDTIQLTSIGVFLNPDKVFFLSPVPGIALVKTHEKMHAILNMVTSGSWEIYEPGKWVPHCTLANDLNIEELKTAISLSTNLELPLNAEVSQIGVVEFEPFKTIFDIDIKH